MDTQALQIQFSIVDYALEGNIEGITDAESRRAQESGCSSMRWLVGHIVKSRNEALALTGQEPIFPVEKFAIFSAAGGESDLTLEDLLSCFRQLRQPLVEGLSKMTQEQLSQPAPFSPTENPDETIGSLLAAYAFHEAYHAGQTGVLRRLLGKSGVHKEPEPI